LVVSKPAEEAKVRVPKIVDAAERREEVLEATWRVMARSGIDRVSIREIASEAGCSTGVIAHYFKNKDDVLMSALFRVSRREADRIRARTEGLKGLEALRAIIEEVLPIGEERTLEMAVWMSFWGRAVGDVRLVAEQRRHYAAWRAVLRRHLREAVESGEIRHVDCSAEAIRLAGLIDGIGIQAVFEQQRLSGRRPVQLLGEYLASLARQR
jgi:AcrR family transcriptional regulator